MTDAYSGSTVLVTGATGLIGSAIVYTLLERGDVRVIAASRSQDKLNTCFGRYFEHRNFSTIVQDASQPLHVQEPVHYIFHAAGPIASNIIRHKPLQVISPNLFGLQNCLEFLREQKEYRGILGRIIIFSSATVYGHRIGENTSVCEDDTQLAEALNERTAAYSEVKRMAEVLGLAYSREYSMDVVIARFSYVYGCPEIEPATAFFDIANKVLCGEDIEILNPEQAILDYIFVTDAVNGVLQVGARGRRGEAYNISSNGELGCYVSMDQLAKHMIDIANTNRVDANKLCLHFPTGGIQRKNGIKMNNQKLKQLGWHLSTSIQDGIEQVLLCKRMRMERGTATTGQNMERKIIP
jgi:nucleoside-diphosphate-sugar epimerase